MTRDKHARSPVRTRRTPVHVDGGFTLEFPWVRAAVVLGVVGVVGLVAYLIVQASLPATSATARAVAAETDAEPGLPGEFIDLEQIYGLAYPDNAPHVRTQVNYVADGNSNPPAGGPHWGSGSCPPDPTTAPAFCGPAPWGIYRNPWNPEVLVHNMEHGGVVVWYNTKDAQIVAELEGLVRGDLEDNRRLVMTPYYDMEGETIALTAWSRIDKFGVTGYDAAQIEAFIDTHEGRFDPERAHLSAASWFAVAPRRDVRTPVGQPNGQAPT